MISRKSISFVFAGVIGLAVLGTMTAPQLRAAIKAALVEVVVPGHPLFQSYSLTDTTIIAQGQATGTFGVSSISILNNSATPAGVNISQVSTAGAACTGAITGSVGGVSLRVIVPGTSTLHLPFPTPLVFFNSVNGTCIGVQSAGGQQVFINGFVD
jgi:hypothetical protein